MLNFFKIFLDAPLSAKFGLLVSFIYAVFSIFAPLLAPYGETEILGAAYELWSDKFLLGTDNIGRDLGQRHERNEDKGANQDHKDRCRGL